MDRIATKAHTTTTMGLLLYSTNVFLKYYIQQNYRGDIHHVWCSEQFDSSSTGRYTAAALVAPSSNPADIYRELQRDVKGRDSHSAKIIAQKATLIRVAEEWHKAGEINNDERDDIVYMVIKADFEQWRPLIYVIPCEGVRSRLTTVPMHKRASFGPEYIIRDLSRSEFDLIEL